MVSPPPDVLRPPSEMAQLQLLPAEAIPGGEDLEAVALPNTPRSSPGRLPATVAQAAQARHRRQEAALPRVPARYPPEVGELCSEGRLWVRRWAFGQISGRQLLLRLESCASVAEVLRDATPAAEGGAEEDETAALGEALLWGAGCAGLGGADRRLRRLQEALETATPVEVLESAREAVERECGAEADGADADDLNWDWALRRIAARARKASDIGSALLVEVWHELLRVHLSASGTDDRGHLAAECREAEEDASVLFWLQRSEEEAREAARAMPQERLTREVERLMDYAARAMLLGGRLRELVEGWSRFDAYRVLGVRKGASKSEVRRAFYRKALVLHPDKGGDKAAFQELQRAYDEVLRHLDEGGEEEGGAAGSGGEDCEEPEESQEAETSHARSDDGSFFRQAQGANAASGAAGAKSRSAPEAGGVAQEEAPVGAAGLQLTVEERRRLASLSRAASAAAEGAKELADRALRCALAGHDALEEEPVGWDAAHEQTEAALCAARELTEAARKVAHLTARAAGLLSRCNKTSCSIHVEISIDGAAVVSVAVELAVRVCLRAIAEAAAALRRSVAEYLGEDPEEEDCLDDSDDFVARLDGAVSALSDATRHLSVAVVDAAETIAEAVLAVGVSLEGKEGEDDEDDEAMPAEEASTAEGEEGTGGGHSFEEEDAEDDSMSAASGDKAQGEARQAQEERDEEEHSLRKVLEARQQLSALLEAVRMMKRTNRELLRLQKSAREAAGTSQADQRQRRAAEEQCRERALVLLAEFLDEAALGLQGGLCRALGASAGQDCVAVRREDSGDGVWSAVEESFGFVTRCAPELAMPQDPRTQALRAAMVFDPEVVRNMLGPQVSQRLQATLMTAFMDAACDVGAGPRGSGLLDGDAGAALDGLQAELLGAHERLAASLAAAGA